MRLAVSRERSDRTLELAERSRRFPCQGSLRPFRAAAGFLAIVFAAISTSSVAIVKMFGLGLTLAVRPVEGGAPLA